MRSLKTGSLKGMREHGRSSSGDNNAVPSPIPRGPAEDTQGRLARNFRRHKLGKIVGGRQKKKISS